MILNEKFFVKSMILNKNFFVLSDFVEVKFVKRVRFWNNFLNTRQILTWILYSTSDFVCTSFAVCQVFICSLKRYFSLMFERMVWVRLVKLFC